MTLSVIQSSEFHGKDWTYTGFEERLNSKIQASKPDLQRGITSDVSKQLPIL